MPNTNKPNTIKVTMSFTVTLDASAWAEYQGVADQDGKYTVAEVRENLRSHCLNTLQSSEFLGEADAEVTLK